MAEPTKVCGECGQKIRKLNPHSMDSQKVRVLEDIAKLNHQGYEWVLAKEGEALETDDGERTRTAYLARAHATRLVWFGLLENQGHRTGAYRVNEDGIKFLGGQIGVPQTIYCREGKVVERSEEQVFIHAVKGVTFDKPYWDNYWQLQKYPADESADLVQRKLL